MTRIICCNYEFTHGRERGEPQHAWGRRTIGLHMGASRPNIWTTRERQRRMIVLHLQGCIRESVLYQCVPSCEYTHMVPFNLVTGQWIRLPGTDFNHRLARVSIWPGVDRHKLIDERTFIFPCSRRSSSSDKDSLKNYNAFRFSFLKRGRLPEAAFLGERSSWPPLINDCIVVGGLQKEDEDVLHPKSKNGVARKLQF